MVRIVGVGGDIYQRLLLDLLLRPATQPACHFYKKTSLFLIPFLTSSSLFLVMRYLKAD